MNRPITLRTLLLTNGLTLLAVVAIIVSTPTFARTLAQITTAATPPATVPYQGTLTDASGTPINDSVAMTFKFYAAPTGGTALWTEQRTGSNAVPVTNGLFSVALGQVTPIPANVLAQPLWLGISVNGDAEMTPREAVAVPAMAATVPDGSITAEKLNLDSGTSCLSENTNVALPGAYGVKTVPGLSLDFSLDKPGKVMFWINGIARFPQSSRNEVSVVLILDGENILQSFGSEDFWWFDIENMRIVNLDSGSHSLALGTFAFNSGTLTLHGSGGYRTCINYLVLGEQ